MRTVLIFSRFFPPMYDVGGKRAYRFARHLHLHGWRAVVVTGAIPEGRAVDPSADLSFPEGVEILRDYYPPGLDFYKNPGTDATSAAPVRARRFPPEGLRERLEWQLRWPVASDIWLAPRFAPLARRLATRYRPDAIFATSSPYSALVFGAVAKRATGLPLCLDLRDPWVLNFLQEKKPPWARAVDAWAERRLMAYADRVTFTCQAARDAYAARYPELGAEKFDFVYNSYDPAQRPAVVGRPPRDRPFTLVHFGNCYGERSLGALIEAMAVLAREDGLGPADLRLINCGRFSADDLDHAASLGVRDQIEVRTAVPHAEGLTLLAGADLQVLASYGDRDLFVPAKFYDYVLAGSPILCLARPSELTDMVARTGRGRSVAPGDVPGIAAALREAVGRRNTGGTRTSTDGDSLEQFSSPVTAGRLAAILDALVEGRPHLASSPRDRARPKG